MKKAIFLFIAVFVGFFLFGLGVPQEANAQGTFSCTYVGSCIYSGENCNNNCYPDTALCGNINDPAVCNGTPQLCTCGGGGPLSPVFGTVNSPPGIARYAGGISQFIGNVVKILIVLAGIWSFFNFVMAGYSYLSAGDDPKKIEGASSKIWQTVIGLIIAAGAFVLAGIFGKLIFDDYNALLQLRVFGPN